MGYEGRSSKSSRVRFRGRGSAGEEENGSNAGSSDVEGFFAAKEGDTASIRAAEGSAIVQVFVKLQAMVRSMQPPSTTRAANRARLLVLEQHCYHKLKYCKLLRGKSQSNKVPYQLVVAMWSVVKLAWIGE